MGALSAAPAWAETIVYDANATPPVTVPLQTVTSAVGSNTVLAPAGSDDTSVPPNKSTSPTNNTITLISGTVPGIFGAVNHQDSDAVTGNKIVVKGGTVTSILFGARAQNLNDANGTTASGNTVTITGGSFGPGVLIGGTRITGSLGLATANDNTVNISGTPTFDPSVQLYGGSIVSTIPTANRVSKNNTLNLHLSDVSVSVIQFFQNLNFYLPSTLTMDGITVPTMLTSPGVSSTAELPSHACAKIGVFLDADTPATLHEGDVTLIKATALTGGSCYDAPNVVPAATNQANKMGDVGGRPYNVWLSGTNLMLTLGLNTEANLVSDPTGLQVTPGGGGSGLTKTAADLIKASVTVPNSKTALTLADVMKIVSTDAAVNIFSDAGFAVNANATGVALNVGSGNHVYIAVTSEDGLNTLYYDLTVTRSLALSTSSAAAVPTLNEWALMLLALAMLGMAGLHTRRRG